MIHLAAGLQSMSRLDDSTMYAVVLPACSTIPRTYRSPLTGTIEPNDPMDTSRALAIPCITLHRTRPSLSLFFPSQCPTITLCYNHLKSPSVSLAPAASEHSLRQCTTARSPGLNVLVAGRAVLNSRGCFDQVGDTLRPIPAGLQNHGGAGRVRAGHWQASTD